jgi:hypothetical protein
MSATLLEVHKEVANEGEQYDRSTYTTIAPPIAAKTTPTNPPLSVGDAPEVLTAAVTAEPVAAAALAVEAAVEADLRERVSVAGVGKVRKERTGERWQSSWRQGLRGTQRLCSRGW